MNLRSDPSAMRWVLRFIPAGFTLTLAALVLTACGRKESSNADAFQRLTSQGRSLYESGDPARAAEVFRSAVNLQPTHPDARQNLANALLRANDAAGAAAEAGELVRMSQNLAAAHFLLGAAEIRQGQAEQAAAALQISKEMDRTVNAVSFLLGRAHQDLGHFEEAAALFDEVVQFETNHPAAYYNLSQVLTRLGRTDEAAQALASHQAILAQRGGAPLDPSAVEACIYTEIRVPFQLDQPDPSGVRVTFTDVSTSILGSAASSASGPLAVIDIHHDGTNDLFVRDGPARFRLLLNSGGRLDPAPNAVAVPDGARFSRVLVGDLNKDRYEDIVLLGPGGLHALRLATNGQITDSTAFSNLRNQPAEDGLLADLDFTGNLDLVLVTPTNRALRVLRNLGNMYFTNGTTSSGFTADLENVAQIVTDDWNGDELNDFFIGRGSSPELWTKQRGGPVARPPSPEPWPSGAVFAVGDVDNDLRNDLLVGASQTITIVLNGFTQRPVLNIPAGAALRGLTLLDYDNDGWLDLFAFTDSALHAWRNLGTGRFENTSATLGFEQLPAQGIASLTAADIDNDGDTDLIASLDGPGLKIFRNEGGNANAQLKLRLLGTRSNSSGLGLRIELTSGNWRALRTVHQLPVEIGVGRRSTIDSLNVRWFDTLSTDIDTPVEQGRQLALIELIRPTGSCPYLYRWNGEEFVFVTDLLGGSPVGLPAAEGFYIQADPDEIVQVGTGDNFKPRDGYYLLQITEELREVLYLDVAKLLVVDHPEGTEVHPTDKLTPGQPFPPSELVLLHSEIPLQSATDLAGTDVTQALLKTDEVRVSPLSLRPPQQRGYADPHGVILDFGPLDSTRPLVLAMTGWLRFGGGMANMSASRDPEVAFPFPFLEVETAAGWSRLDTVVGAPCGKTKTILVDLAGILPPDVRRLRLTASFEIHWDRITLFERAGRDLSMAITRLAPEGAEMHWRGYSEYFDLPWTHPLTPDYRRVRAWPDWRINPSGWCTRYGEVGELIAARDGGLALINGGDELTVRFAADQVPPVPEGMQRSFFLFTVGWDKDADYHVVLGDRVGPLPWEGMDDQRYGTEERPPHPGDALNQRFNTRWVGPMAQSRR